MDTRRATYIGAYAPLRWKVALVRPVRGNPKCVFAQFDDVEATMKRTEGYDVLVGRGWHVFKRDEFEVSK